MQILQINLNKSGKAQDLMLQYMRENKIGVALISEPNRIPGGNWFGEEYGLTAIHWGIDESCILAGRGKWYVAVESEGKILVSTYCLPNTGRVAFERLLEGIKNNIIAEYKKKKIIIGGGVA